VDADRFDRLARNLTRAMPRRGLLGLAALALPGALVVAGSAAAGGKKGLRAKCSGGDTCRGDLMCGKPTTRHSCGSSIPRRGKWCCVAPGDRCNGECDCCGNNYCGGNGRCIRNPEG
jgi:hypothetical protein